MPPTHTDEGLRAAAVIRERHPKTAVLLLSSYLEARYAEALLTDHPARSGYLLKDRVYDAAGRAAHVVVADLSDTAQAARLSGAARQAFGRLDVVVNNVGGAIPRPFLDTTAEALEEAFRFNVSTAHALITAAIPLMLDNGGGSVINISSVMALISGRGFLSYGTAKGALARYTELAAQDLAPRIRVNAIAAGTIATAATEVITADAGLRSRVEAATPLRRLGTVDDVAAAVLYLASPASAYLTGTVLEVHGGLQAPNTQQPLPDL